MVKLPKNVNVFGKQYQVIHSDKPEGGFHPEIHYGFCDSTSYKIYIAKGKDHTIHTYIHELVHAMCDRIGLRQTGLQLEIEEIICEGVATVITEAFDIKIKVSQQRTSQ